MSFPIIHRVVTGHDAQGKSVVVSHGPLPTVRALQALPGLIFHEVWETRGTPAPVDNGEDPTLGPLMHQPPERGTRIRFVDFPPDDAFRDQAAAQMKALFDEVNDGAALTTREDSPHPMMHRSEAVDYCIVLEGEMVLVLDESEVVLTAGSVVIQRGTNHAWANRTGGVCRMLFVQLDGKYDPAVTDALVHRGVVTFGS